MFEQTFKSIDDVLWKEAGCTTELDYTEQTSWILFLKYLDDLEQGRAMEAELGSRHGTGSWALLGVGALGWFRDSRTLFLLWFEHPDATQVQC